MDSKLVAAIQERFVNESDEVLLKIWESNNQDEYSDEAFEAIKKILLSRGISLPSQKEVIKASASSIDESIKAKDKISSFISLYQRACPPYLLKFAIAFLAIWFLVIALNFGTSGQTTHFLNGVTSRAMRWLYQYFGPYRSIMRVGYSDAQISGWILATSAIFEKIARQDVYAGFMPLATLLSFAISVPWRAWKRLVLALLGLPIMLAINAALLAFMAFEPIISLRLAEFFDVLIIWGLCFCVRQPFAGSAIVLMVLIHRLSWSMSHSFMGVRHGLLFQGWTATGSAGSVSNIYWNILKIDASTFIISFFLVAGFYMLRNKQCDEQNLA
jgi:hypothetical protein